MWSSAQWVNSNSGRFWNEDSFFSWYMYADISTRSLRSLIYRVSQLKRNTYQWFIVLRLEGKYLCTVYDMVR